MFKGEVGSWGLLKIIILSFKMRNYSIFRLSNVPDDRPRDRLICHVSSSSVRNRYIIYIVFNVILFN